MDGGAPARFRAGLTFRTLERPEAVESMTTYRAVLLKGRGGLDQLQEVELPLEPPGPGQIRLRVRASGVGFTDITKRTGHYPYAPKFPFVDGYEVVGDVDALGEGV